MLKKIYIPRYLYVLRKIVNAVWVVSNWKLSEIFTCNLSSIWKSCLAKLSHINNFLFLDVRKKIKREKFSPCFWLKGRVIEVIRSISSKRIKLYCGLKQDSFVFIHTFGYKYKRKHVKHWNWNLEIFNKPEIQAPLPGHPYNVINNCRNLQLSPWLFLYFAQIELKPTIKHKKLQKILLILSNFYLIVGTSKISDTHSPMILFFELRHLRGLACDLCE